MVVAVFVEQLLIASKDDMNRPLWLRIAQRTDDTGHAVEGMPVPGKTSGDHDRSGKRVAEKYRKYQNEQNQQNVVFSAAICMLGNGKTEVCRTNVSIHSSSQRTRPQTNE